MLLSDAELWEGIRNNDKHSFDVLFERYWSSVYTTAFSYLRDKDLCTEIVHDVFLNIWQKRSELNIVSFKSYLTTSSRYQVYKCLKKRSSSSLIYIEDYDKVVETVKDVNHGEQKIDQGELEKNIGLVLNHLPQRCQQIFAMSRVDHLSNQEIAQRLGISKRTVENQITTALKHLRVYLKYIVFFLILNSFIFSR